jgi:hypothetical protein
MGWRWGWNEKIDVEMHIDVKMYMDVDVANGT